MERCGTTQKVYGWEDVLKQAIILRPCRRRRTALATVGWSYGLTVSRFEDPQDQESLDRGLRRLRVSRKNSSRTSVIVRLEFVPIPPSGCKAEKHFPGRFGVAHQTSADAGRA
jgi:hypothetical protein